MSAATPAGAAAGCALTVVVLTYNEERNLAACLDSVRTIAQQTFVVDSGSTDRTLDIAASFGATIVAHPFDTHARQWRWALDALPIQTSWVLGLDADQRLTGEAAAAIALALNRTAGDVAGPQGYFLNRRQIFRGRWIRHGGYYPKYLLKLFRRDAVRIDVAELVDHHFEIAGPVATLRGDLIEDNQNEDAIAAWTIKHNRYAVLQARQELDRLGEGTGIISPSSPDASVRRHKRVWRRLPLFVRPCLYFTYRYVLRLGFLDGKEGFIFHALQAFWYRLLVDINIDEMRTGASPVAAADPAARPIARPTE